MNGKIGRDKMLRWAMRSLIVVLLAGCSTPQARQIQAVDSSQDTVQFLYEEELPNDRWDRGVVECDIDGNELINCRRIDAEYR